MSFDINEKSIFSSKRSRYKIEEFRHIHFNLSSSSCAKEPYFIFPSVLYSVKVNILEIFIYSGICSISACESNLMFWRLPYFALEVPTQFGYWKGVVIAYIGGQCNHSTKQRLSFLRFCNLLFLGVISLNT